MATPDALARLERDLRDIFGNRMQSLVAYAIAAPHAPETHTLALVDTLSADDLRACAASVAEWHDAGLATPLMLEAHEFGRSLDAFPFEFGAILADYRVVAGHDPFEGLRVNQEDARRACEVQARSHLLHLREGYIEARGRGDAIAELIRRSAGSIAALLRHVDRLTGRPHDDAVLRRVAALGEATLSSDDARQLFPAYLSALHRLTSDIDRWGAK